MLISMGLDDASNPLLPIPDTHTYPCWRTYLPFFVLSMHWRHCWYTYLPLLMHMPTIVRAFFMHVPTFVDLPLLMHICTYLNNKTSSLRYHLTYLPFWCMYPAIYAIAWKTVQKSCQCGACSAIIYTKIHKLLLPQEATIQQWNWT